jgi:hypothetical protein
MRHDWEVLFGVVEGGSQLLDGEFLLVADHFGQRLGCCHRRLHNLTNLFRHLVLQLLALLDVALQLSQVHLGLAGYHLLQLGLPLQLQTGLVLIEPRNVVLNALLHLLLTRLDRHQEPVVHQQRRKQQVKLCLTYSA